MQLTAAHCREQQAIQLAKAESEVLESRKQIALVAAAAWGAEAVEADKRAAGKVDGQDAEFAREFAEEAEAEALLKDGDFSHDAPD
jgi:hypothetical protein